eukprot:1160868-Pelagomonas_calceolata.AAC.8
MPCLHVLWRHTLSLCRASPSIVLWWGQQPGAAMHPHFFTFLTILLITSLLARDFKKTTLHPCALHAPAMEVSGKKHPVCRALVASPHECAACSCTAWARANSRRLWWRWFGGGCSVVRYTPLHCAVEGRQPEAVVALLLKGASCTIKDYVSKSS